MSSNTRYLTALPTAAVLLCSYISAVNLPDRNIYLPQKEESVMATKGTAAIAIAPWEDYVSSYYIISNAQKSTEQISIIHNFVSLLLKESQGLDPKYSKIVDKYFWDLV